MFSKEKNRCKWADLPLGVKTETLTITCPGLFANEELRDLGSPKNDLTHGRPGHDCSFAKGIRGTDFQNGICSLLSALVMYTNGEAWCPTTRFLFKRKKLETLCDRRLQNLAKYTLLGKRRILFSANVHLWNSACISCRRCYAQQWTCDLPFMFVSEAAIQYIYICRSRHPAPCIDAKWDHCTCYYYVS